MEYDLLIRNGTVVDGTGASRFAADVGIAGARITAIGTIPAAASAAQVIDAQGKIVCPGFIDPHTHYDPQITWDNVLASSSEHGITTIMMGNCGVGVAPCRPADRDLMIQDLVNVESMSQEVLRAGIKWDWETFPQYMDSAAKNANAINRAFMVPLAPLRTYVMGESASDRAADKSETEKMADMLEGGMEAGSWGHSTTGV